jgi:hypothetical protein
MPGEPWLATRSPDGQMLREWDRYPAEAARALKADLERALGSAVDFTAQGRALYATDASITARCRSASPFRARGGT